MFSSKTARRDLTGQEVDERSGSPSAAVELDSSRRRREPGAAHGRQQSKDRRRVWSRRRPPRSDFLNPIEPDENALMMQHVMEANGLLLYNQS